MSSHKNISEEVCPLCLRPIPSDQRDEHHLVPKCKGGKKTLSLHRACHRQIHMLFTESELAQKYCTAESLLENENMAKFVKWIEKKPNDFLPAFRQSARTRN